MIVKTHQNQPQQDKHIIHTLVGMGIDSLLWVPTEAEAELSEWLTITGIPVAVVTQVSRFFNSVSINQDRGLKVLRSILYTPVIFHLGLLPGER